MQSRRRASLYNSETTAITPAVPIAGLMTRSELVSLVSDLRTQNSALNERVKALTTQVATMRRAHDKAEGALVKFNALLEATLRDQRQAWEQLGQPLQPTGTKR